MNKLEILLLENSDLDAKLITLFLHRKAPKFNVTTVETKIEFTNALDRNHFDMVLAGNSLKGFNANQALGVTRDKDADIPFILLSGSVTEEFAIDFTENEAADDYIFKDYLNRLPTAMYKAIIYRKTKLEKKTYENLLLKLSGGKQTEATQNNHIN